MNDDKERPDRIGKITKDLLDLYKDQADAVPFDEIRKCVESVSLTEAEEGVSKARKAVIEWLDDCGE